MDFSPAALLASLVVSTVGFGLFRYGKHEQRLPQLVGGLALMIGPYVLGSALATWLFGALIGGLIWAAARLGW